MIPASGNQSSDKIILERNLTGEYAMPPLILWALGAVGATIVGRWLYKESQRINAELHPETPAPADERTSARKLERDPQTGVYRPK
jgi:hypothetical protein